LTDNYLKIRGIEATLKLAESNNAKVVIFGSSPNGLPIVLSGDSASPAAQASAAPVSVGPGAGGPGGPGPGAAGQGRGGPPSGGATPPSAPK
jgi:hypothetical protein